MSNFEVSKNGNVTIFKVVNERLDSQISANAKAELSELSAAGAKNIIIDVSNVKYCDSSGLSVILVGNRLCKQSGGKLVIAGPNEFVSKLITISQLDSILKITPGIKEALNAYLS